MRHRSLNSPFQVALHLASLHQVGSFEMAVEAALAYDQIQNPKISILILKTLKTPKF